jgi:hypothetical protein
VRSLPIVYPRMYCGASSTVISFASFEVIMVNSPWFVGN